MWKRFGSDKPQQSAAARRDPSLDERPERQAAVARIRCPRLHRWGTDTSRVLLEAWEKRGGSRRLGARAPQHLGAFTAETTRGSLRHVRSTALARA